jgi:hypothetical protein
MWDFVRREVRARQENRMGRAGLFFIKITTIKN